MASGECAADGGGAGTRTGGATARVPAEIAGGLPSRGGRSGVRVRAPPQGRSHPHFYHFIPPGPLHPPSCWG